MTSGIPFSRQNIDRKKSNHWGPPLPFLFWALTNLIYQPPRVAYLYTTTSKTQSRRKVTQKPSGPMASASPTTRLMPVSTSTHNGSSLRASSPEVSSPS